MDVRSTLNTCKEQINASIDRLLPSPNAAPALIHEAMHYSLKAGGKRLRPMLLIAAFELFRSEEDPLPAAVAVECLHTYTLIHDDLPCMDNSDLRRGIPTNHIKFGEATAVLAGDALLTFSFSLLSEHYKGKPELAVDLVQVLAHAAGSTKLIGGQVEDFHVPKEALTAEKLQRIHLNKTEALITASLTMGLRLGTAYEEKLPLIKTLGYHLGLAFQIIDDILDMTAKTEAMGKPAGLDAQNDKGTHPQLHGLETSYSAVKEHIKEIHLICNKLGGGNDLLMELLKIGWDFVGRLG